MSVIRGKLKLKSKFAKKIQREKQLLLRKVEKQQEKKERLMSEIPDVSLDVGTKTLTFTPQPASGRILTTGRIVMGQDTKFTAELEAGDEIIAMIDPVNFKKESRVISMITSDRSLSLKEAFSKNLISYCQFEFKKQDKVVDGDQSIDQKYREKILNFKKKIVKPKSFVEYRVKKGMWGYKKARVEVDRELTREEMLNMRVKAKKDKWCWY